MIEIDWKPDARKLREFAVVWLVGFGLIGLAVAWKGGALSGKAPWTAPIVLWVVAAAVGLVGSACPEAVRPVYIAWMAIALPIGWVVSHVIMALIYYGVFTPIGLVFRLMGHDPMYRTFDPDAGSYWVRRRPASATKRYFQQF